MGILQNFPAKVMCMYFFKIKLQFYCFPGKSIIFARETTRKSIWFLISRVTCSNVCKKLLRRI